MSLKSETMSGKPAGGATIAKKYIETHKHPNYLMKLDANDVIENLFIGEITKESAPAEDQLVIVTVFEDTQKTTFALQLDRPHAISKCYWDAFVLARETTPLPEIRPNRLLEVKNA